MLFDRHHDHTVGAKTDALVRRYLLVVFASRNRRETRRPDAGAEQIVANGRRALDRELQVRVFFPDGIGVTDNLDRPEPALPGGEYIVQLGVMRLVQPILVVPELQHVNARCGYRRHRHAHGHALSGDADVEACGLRSEIDRHVVGIVLHRYSAAATDDGGFALSGAVVAGEIFQPCQALDGAGGGYFGDAHLNAGAKPGNLERIDAVRSEGRQGQLTVTRLT